jgi:hypothetical protein
MKQFEDEVVVFLKPILEGNITRTLTEKEQNSLAGWLALITTLAEYASYRHPTIKRSALLHLKKHRVPPNNFNIYVARSTGTRWRQWYRFHNFIVGEEISIPLAADGRPSYNTQITTMGIGNLLAQVFSGPAHSAIESYSIAVEGSDLERVWPPKKSFWMRKYRPLEFPLKAEFSDHEADVLADELHRRIATMSHNL